MHSHTVEPRFECWCIAGKCVVKIRVVYRLTDIELLLERVVASLKKGPIPAKTKSEILAALRKEQQRILIAYKKETLIQNDERLLFRFFSLHQQGLIQLLDRLYAVQEDYFSIAKKPVVLNEFRVVFLELVTEIEQQHSKYFNMGLTVPRHVSNAFREEVCKEMSIVNDTLKTGDIEDGLKELVTDIIETASKPGEMTFARLGFYKTFARMQQQIRWYDRENKTLDDTIRSLMITLNFNSVQFINYFTNYLTRLFDQCETVSDQILMAAFQLKRIQQSAPIQNIAWEFGMPDVKTQIVEWLSYELDYLHTKAETVTSDKTSSVSKDFKFKLDSSVSQLSYVIRILLETGIIQNGNTSELIRFITKFVSTKKSEAISFDSFRLKFYNPESGTKDAVKNTLQKLHGYIIRN